MPLVLLRSFLLLERPSKERVRVRRDDSTAQQISQLKKSTTAGAEGVPRGKGMRTRIVILLLSHPHSLLYPFSSWIFAFFDVPRKLRSFYLGILHVCLLSGNFLYIFCLPFILF